MLYVPAQRRLQMLACVKLWAEETRVPIVLVAPPKLASRLLSNDWGQRFEILTLPRLRLDRDFLAMLQAWEMRLPLQQPSNLADREMALHLYALCDGNMGRLSTILRQAAIEAIDHGSERITITLLDRMNFVPPESFNGFHF
jgi:hypothetical protein